MKNLTHLTNKELLNDTKELAQKEREILSDILYHLREIKNRNLHLELGYSSVREYCMGELSYSGAAAWRRVNAMYLLEEMPELRSPIEEGKLTLSNLSLVGSFFKQEKKQGVKEYETKEKREIIKEIETKTTEDCMRILGDLSPSFKIKQEERVRPVNSSYVEMKLMVTAEFARELEELKNLISHELKTGKMTEVIECSVRKVLNGIRKKKGIKISGTKEESEEKKEETKSLIPNTNSRSKRDQIKINSTPNKNQSPPFAANKVPRFGTVKDQRVTWQRAENQCEYRDEKTGRRCLSRFRLEIDHIVPHSFNGSSDAHNLRLLCQMHHRFVTEKVFGRFVR